MDGRERDAHCGVAFNSVETAMNKDQVKGRAKEVAGKIEKNVGRAIGNPKVEAKGLVKEVAGKVQKNVGDVVNKEFDRP
jgi:uncharacterized protein YjbJ (UPF0337 family)